MKKIIICFLAILCPLLVNSQKDMNHNYNVLSHSDMVSSIQVETAAMENKIKNVISIQGNAYNIDLNYFKSQRKSIFEKCIIYSSLGGQRSELLESQCELDAVSDFYDFIKIYMRSMDDN